MQRIDLVHLNSLLDGLLLVDSCCDSDDTTPRFQLVLKYLHCLRQVVVTLLPCGEKFRIRESGDTKFEIRVRRWS